MNSRSLNRSAVVVGVFLLIAAAIPHVMLSHGGVQSGKAAFPNPFKQNTTFILTMPREAKIKIDVYNIRGQHIKNLFGGESGMTHEAISNPAGENIPWDGTDLLGAPAPPGMYLCVLQSDGKTVKSVKVVKQA